jgi:hypothetical protein
MRQNGPCQTVPLVVTRLLLSYKQMSNSYLEGEESQPVEGDDRRHCGRPSRSDLSTRRHAHGNGTDERTVVEGL